MFDDPFPSADVHFYGNVYHDWPAGKWRFLTGKSYGALPSRGRLVIHEMLYDNDKNGPLEAAVYSVVMLLWQRGRQYSGAELTRMLTEAGFIEIEVKRSLGYGALSAAARRSSGPHTRRRLLSEHTFSRPLSGI